MLSSDRRSLMLLTGRDRIIIYSLGIFRIFLGILDLLGILLLGLLLTNATNQLTNNQGTGVLSKFRLTDLIQQLSLFQIATFTLLTFVGKSILSLSVMKYTAIKLASVENSIAAKYFSVYMSAPFLFANKMSKQNLTYALTLSTSYATTKIITYSMTILSEAVLLISIAFLFALINLKIMIGIAIYFLLIGFAMQRVVGSQYAKIGKANTESTINTFATIEDSVQSFREIVTLKKQNEFKLQFVNNRHNYAKANANLDFLTSVPRYIVESALMVGALALAAFTFKVSSTAEAAGILGVFLTGGLRIMASMLPLQASLGSFRQVIEQSKPFFQLVELAENKVERLTKKSNLKKSISPLGIEFNNVSFTYPGANSHAIEEITFSIAPGQIAAFVGPSGSGKSTIADLIIGIIEPTSGEIKFSGMETKDSDHNFGYVPQSPGLIHGAISENITMNVFTKDTDTSLMADAIKLANLDSLINSLDSGVETDLGKNSDALSGGQLQRIGLARAVYDNPSLLVLDEATSSLDPESESTISAALFKLKGKCTTVIIAHRLATVQNADKVFVVDSGKIVAEGNFSELAKSNSIVAKYVKLSELNTD